MSHEILQDREFPWCQTQFGIAAMDGMCGRVEMEVAGGQDRRTFGRPPAGQSTQPGDQHDDRERFGEIVVGAEIERVGQVVLPALGGQHEHRCPHLRGAHPANHLVAVEARQHDVEHDHVELRTHGAVQARYPVTGDLHDPALRHERPPDGLGHVAVVFHQQDAHVPTKSPSHGR